MVHRWLNLFTRFGKRRNPVPERLSVEAALNDALKLEVEHIARQMKSSRVSVRALYEGEIPTDTPEIDDKPMS